MTAATPTSVQLKSEISAYAHSLGFSRVGFASADPIPGGEKALSAWLADGRAGEMDYMKKNWPLRARPGEFLPGARSVIALAISYYDGSKSPATDEGRVARYAWGKDYHKVIQKRLDALTRYVESLAANVHCKTFLDTGPLLERAVAQKAGLGFVGKNTMLITRGLGSYVFLASVVTTLDLPDDTPDLRNCGTCRLCIDACPTEAITGPYQLDARKCIAYLTIESRNPIPEPLQPKLGNWVFGCDICQEVCPHNTRLPDTPIAEFRASAGAGPVLNLTEVLSLKDDPEFDTRFAGTPLKRAKRAGLQRNAAVAKSNQ